MDRKKLTPDEIHSETKKLHSDWKLANDRLQRSYQFKNFVQAFGFLTQVAIHAQSLDHHPKIVNVYNQVEIELWTHDVGGLTSLDFQLAKLMDETEAG